MALTVEPQPAPFYNDEHGRARVTGTRFPVEFIVQRWNVGDAPETIARSFAPLTLPLSTRSLPTTSSIARSSTRTSPSLTRQQTGSVRRWRRSTRPSRAGKSCFADGPNEVPRFLADHNFNEAILGSLARRGASLDVVLARDVNLARTSDEDSLELASEQGMVVLTHDITTLVPRAWDRVRAKPCDARSRAASVRYWHWSRR
jgi:hypothetical protein